MGFILMPAAIIVAIIVFVAILLIEHRLGTANKRLSIIDDRLYEVTKKLDSILDALLAVTIKNTPDQQ